MSLFTTWKRASVGALAAVATVSLAVAAMAAPGSASAAPAFSGKASMAAMAMAPGRGENDYGMTKAFFHGRALSFTYAHGYYCDTSVHSYASTKCEVGQKFNHAPSPQFDPLFITVPLGFSPKKMVECPATLTCVDHPMTVDLTRLEPALKPLYPSLTDAQLTNALKNTMTPGHDHFVTTKFGGKREWWPVYVVGVTSPKTYRQIQNHRSYGYIHRLIKNGNKNVTGVIPSNIFLYFSVQR